MSMKVAALFLALALSSGVHADAAVRACTQAGSDDCPLSVLVPPSKRLDSQGIDYTKIPASFLGFSQEWPWVSSLTGSDHIFSIFKQLQAGKQEPLVFRIGGADADAGWDRMFNPANKDYGQPDSEMRRNGIKSTYTELARLKNQLNIKVIATVNLANRDLNLALDQAQNLRNVLGDSLLSLEIGNEPNYYLSHVPEYWTKDSFYSDIIKELDRFAVGLNCQHNCAGPAWGWIGLKPDMMRNYLKASASKLNFVTVHYYKSAYRPDDPNNDTTESLLQDNGVIDQWIKPQVAVGREFGVPVRIGESNAISGGGHDGVSNSYAAAIWTLDSCLSMAAAGVAGIDFHQGSYKYAMYRREEKSAAKPDLPLPVNYRVQPNFYGMLMFQWANRDGSSIYQLPLDSHANVKAFQLESAEGYRTVILNKDPYAEKVVDLLLPYQQIAPSIELTELKAPGNKLDAMSGITLAGQSYDSWGAVKTGSWQSQWVNGEATDKPGYLRFHIRLQPATAVMLRTP